mmetsp:Transcript_32709/g.93383  ORF Transcript_32709/g.93383 Transcript_32709/m.93383 type:complete len:208 (-) Transcript_32709:822-1445(-)
MPCRRRFCSLAAMLPSFAASVASWSRYFVLLISSNTCESIARITRTCVEPKSSLAMQTWRENTMSDMRLSIVRWRPSRARLRPAEPMLKVSHQDPSMLAPMPSIACRSLTAALSIRTILTDGSAPAKYVAKPSTSSVSMLMLTMACSRLSLAARIGHGTRVTKTATQRPMVEVTSVVVVVASMSTCHVALNFVVESGFMKSMIKYTW